MNYQKEARDNIWKLCSESYSELPSSIAWRKVFEEETSLKRLAAKRQQVCSDIRAIQNINNTSKLLGTKQFSSNRFLMR